MDGLAPTLQICFELRMALERGEALSRAIQRLAPTFERELRNEVFQLAQHFERHGPSVAFRCKSQSLLRRELFDLIANGLAGAPVVTKLKELEVEIKLGCEHDIENFLARLPLIAMLPVMLIQFPAFLLLLFGPILNELTRSLL